MRSADQGEQWRTKGADVAVASLDDGPSLTRAVQGASGLYLLIPPNHGASAWLSEQRERMDRAVAAIKAGGVEHVVLLSSVGAQLSDGTGPIRAVQYGEQQLRGDAQCDGTASVLLHGELGDRPWHGQGTGSTPTFIAPQARIPMISTGDIGRVAADRLMAADRGM